MRKVSASRRPVKVCFLIDELAKAGTESQLLALIRHVDRTRVQPYLVLLRGSSNTSQALEPLDCPVMRLGVGSLKNPLTVFKAWRFIQFLWREQIDVVQVYFPDSTYFGIPAAWLAGVRYRIRTRNNVGHWMTPTHKRLGRGLNLFTTVTVANCEAAREALLRDEQPQRERICVLENGVDLDRFLNIPLPIPYKEAPLVVGAVANLRHVKGLDVLVDAAVKVRSLFPRVEFRVAGEGEVRSDLQQQINRLGLDQHFHLVGSQSDIPAFLDSLDIAVLPSRAEGMSNALLEYMAAARPIVATAVGATPEILHEGVHGLLIPPDSSVALSTALLRLVENRSFACQLGQAARLRVIEKYSRQAMVRRFEDFYTTLMTHAEQGLPGTSVVGSQT